VGRDFHQEVEMNRRSANKLVREGVYAADVPVDFIEDDTGWSPYLSPEDAYKLDDVAEGIARR
jgi:hypothetical protein